MDKLTKDNAEVLAKLAKNKKPSLWARVPWYVKAAAIAALWFVLVYVPSLGLK